MPETGADVPEVVLSRAIDRAAAAGEWECILSLAEHGPEALVLRAIELAGDAGKWLWVRRLAELRDRIKRGAEAAASPKSRAVRGASAGWWVTHDGVRKDASAREGTLSNVIPLDGRRRKVS